MKSSTSTINYYFYLKMKNDKKKKRKLPFNFTGYFGIKDVLVRIQHDCTVFMNEKQINAHNYYKLLLFSWSIDLMMKRISMYVYYLA